MKKILLSLGVVFSAAAVSAQVDTLTDFFSGSPTIYGVQGGGYVGGNNSYGDLAKMQLFDANYGVTSGGNITGVCLWAPVKSGTGNFQVKIWANNAGAPGAELGSATVSLSAVDTSAAALMGVVDPGMTGGFAGYNVAVTFASAIAIPTSLDFWAGVVLPTAAGDTLALVSNTDGDFGGAGATHAGEFWSDNSFWTIGDANNWGLDVAFAIFPVVNFVAGVNEEAINATVYPNPTADALNIKLSANATAVSIIGMDGKVISTESVNGNTLTVDVAGLVAGVYVYEIVAENGTVVRNTFVKK